MLKRAHTMPRLILNKVGAYTTDTIYRIQTKEVSPTALVTSFINPLTALSAELEGRHYGGGVLELVPSEIENLLIPLPTTAFDLKELDNDIRTNPISSVLETHGRKVLEDIGLSKSKQTKLISGWEKLASRRQRVSVEVD
jgi:hypothetical protein